MWILIYRLHLFFLYEICLIFILKINVVFQTHSAIIFFLMNNTTTPVNDTLIETVFTSKSIRNWIPYLFTIFAGLILICFCLLIVTCLVRTCCPRSRRRSGRMKSSKASKAYSAYRNKRRLILADSKSTNTKTTQEHRSGAQSKAAAISHLFGY